MFSITRKLSPLTTLRRPLPLPFPLSSPTSRPTLLPSPACSPHPAEVPAAANSILSLLRRFSSQPPSSPSPISLAFIRGGCHDDVHPHFSPLSLPLPLCPGCGVHMQDSDSSLPGFFSRPSIKSPDYHAPISPLPLSSTSDPETSLSLKSGHLQELSEGDRDHLPENSSSEDPKPLVCARCHSLRHYGRVREPSAENLLPDFDFDLMIAPKMASPSGPRSVVLFVVDAADFDGSFPRKVARLLSTSIDRNALAWKENKPANIPRIILVVTKLDLLPPSLSPEMLDNWVRRRANALGAAKLAGLHLVSAVRDWGVRNLVEQVAEFAGPRGNVWAVGAQNAGKSTLINAMARCVGRKMIQLTEAPVPGTTLGIVRVEGVLSGQAKLFDTPGILHPYQITTRLTREEQKLVHISKELKPRTYRIMAKLFDTPGILHPYQITTRLTREEQKLVHISKELKPRTYRIMAGHSVHIGGLMRLDVEESSADSIYFTVWASPLLPLHMGKQQNSHIMMEDHFGRQLQPPIGVNRVTELGKLVRTEFRVSGDSWDESTTDIAAAGLGWVAVCLKGEALLSVWTYDGINVVLRSSLITKKAKIFEEAGFTASKVVSKADSIFSKERQNRPDKRGSCRI